MPPVRYADLAVLRGDPSDGLPGARGIGAKTAAALIDAFGGLEDILSAAQDPETGRPMTPAVRRSLVDSADELRRVEQVVRLRPLDWIPRIDPHESISSQATSEGLDLARDYGVLTAAKRLTDALRQPPSN